MTTVKNREVVFIMNVQSLIIKINSVKMKKLMFVSMVLMVCSSMMFQLSAQDYLEDLIELRREGGTTRLTGAKSMMSSSSASYSMSKASVVAAPVTVEASSNSDVVTLAVYNYRGAGWVEIIGEGGFRHSFFQVYDMGMEVINISDLRNGKYNIRITLGNSIFSGSFKINK